MNLNKNEDLDWAVASGHKRINTHPLFRIFATVLLRLHNHLANDFCNTNNELSSDEIFDKVKYKIRCFVLDTARKVLAVVYTDNRKKKQDNFFRVAKNNPRLMRQSYKSVPYELKIAYTFHEFLPNEILINNKLMDSSNFSDITLAKWLDYLIKTPSGRICIQNTPEKTINIIIKYIEISRNMGLRRYNSYRKFMGFNEIKSFNDFNCLPEIRDKLKNMYNTIDEMDLIVGLYAEKIDVTGKYGCVDFLPPVFNKLVSNGLSFLLLSDQTLDNNFIKANFDDDDISFFDNSTSELISIVVTNLSDDFINKKDLLSLIN